jgi:20S proteasome subunit beta 6
VARKNQLNVVQTESTQAEIEDLVKDAFNSAGERDIYTGDFVDMCTITPQGIKTTKFDLKFD